MCLIALAWNSHPRFALVIAANRDEFHERAAAPAAIQPDDRHVIGGVDLQAGGSWLQFSTRGRFAAVTNVRRGFATPVCKRSRGALVVDFVRSNEHAAAFSASLGPTSDLFGKHTLLLWDGMALWQSGNCPSAYAEAIGPGVHSLSNAELDAPWPKSAQLKTALNTWLESADSALATPNVSPLFDALANDHEAPDSQLPMTGVPLEWERRLSPAFVRGADYGTRCSTLVLVAHSGEWAFEERRYGPNGVDIGRSHWHGHLVS